MSKQNKEPSQSETDKAYPCTGKVRRNPRSRDPKRRVVLTAHRLTILLFLFRYKIASRDQIACRYAFSIHFLNKILRGMYDLGVVRRLDTILPGTTGTSQQMIYGIASSAFTVETLANALEIEEGEVRSRCKLPVHIAHALMITQVGGMLEKSETLLQKYGIRLGNVLIEGDATDHFVLRRSSDNKEEPYTIRPDLFLSVLSQNGARIHLAFECDRGNVSTAPWIEKAKHFVVWQRSSHRNGACPLAELHGTGPLRVLVITSGANRMANLASLCHEAGAGSLYVFTTRRIFEEAYFRHQRSRGEIRKSGAGSETWVEEAIWQTAESLSSSTESLSSTKQSPHPNGNAHDSIYKFNLLSLVQIIDEASH
jgi:hypothetical protein